MSSFFLGLNHLTGNPDVYSRILIRISDTFFIIQVNTGGNVIFYAHWSRSGSVCTDLLLADTYPVVCTEIGFCLEDEPGAHIPVMSTEIYGEHITKYFEQKGISFTVWCFDTSWAPMLISDWDFTPTTQGRFFKAYLQRNAK